MFAQTSDLYILSQLDEEIAIDRPLRTIRNHIYVRLHNYTQGSFTVEEDRIILKYLKRGLTGIELCKKIGLITNRPPNVIMCRIHALSGFKKGRFSKEEVERLTKIIYDKYNGRIPRRITAWTDISLQLGTRSPSQCRFFWCNKDHISKPLSLVTVDDARELFQLFVSSLFPYL